MDFNVDLIHTSQHHDSIWVIIDRLTKTAHFIPVHTTYKAKRYAEIYIDHTTYHRRCRHRRTTRKHSGPRTPSPGDTVASPRRLWPYK